MPVDQFDRKWSCITCIRGHRTGECKHYDRYMVHVRHPGRPSMKCKHSDPFKCNCAGVYRAILVEWRKPETRQGNGHKARDDGYPQGKVVSIEVNVPATSNEIPAEKMPDATAAADSESQPVFVGHPLKHFEDMGVMKQLEEYWKQQQPKAAEAPEKSEQQTRRLKKHARRNSKLAQQQDARVEQQPLPTELPSVFQQQPLPEQAIFQQPQHMPHQHLSPQHLVPVLNVSPCNYSAIQPAREQGLPAAVHHSHQESTPSSFSRHSTGPDGSHDGCCLSENELLEMHEWTSEQLQLWQEAQKANGEEKTCSCPPQLCSCVNCTVHSFNDGDMENLVQNVLPHINPTEWNHDPSLRIEPNAQGVLQPRYVNWPVQMPQQVDGMTQNGNGFYPSAPVGGSFGQEQVPFPQEAGFQQTMGQDFMALAGEFSDFCHPAENHRRLIVNYGAAMPSCCPPDCMCAACSEARMFADPTMG